MDLSQASIIGFLYKNRIVNEKEEPISFEHRLFLYDIFRDWSKYQVIKKAAQIGLSTTMIIKSLFAPRAFGWNIIYSLPSDHDVNNFVAAKTNKIIQANPVWHGLQTDNIERKQIGDRFLFYQGTVSKSAAIMTTADLLIHDELDRSDLVKIENLRSRVKASNYGGIWKFSNPSVERAGVDLEWQKSDQKEWEVLCSGCQLWQQLSWPDSINLKTKQYQCKNCGKELSDKERAYGRWTPQVPGAPISGYHISLLMAPWISASSIIEESELDQEHFYNFILGEPWSPGDMRVSRTTILDCWTPRNLETGRWFLGVDVGNLKHYVLGSEKGIIKVGKFADWNFLDELLEKYKPICVIDAMPENTMSRYYVKKYPNVFMNYYKLDRNRKDLIIWGKRTKQSDDTGVVFSDRNRLIDTVITDLQKAKILYGLHSDRDFREYLKHWETMRRVKVVNNIGIERYEWESTTGQDHFVHATVYYYLALQAAGSGVVIAETQTAEHGKLIVQTMEGPKLRSLKEVMEEQQYGGY